MSFINSFLGKLFHRSGEEEDTYPVISASGKKLNYLYHPRPRKDVFLECDRIVDDFMVYQGYRKYLAGDQIPKPKKRFLRKSERLSVGDVKTMLRVKKFKN